MNPEASRPTQPTEAADTDQMVQLMAWLETNKKRLVIAAVVAVALGGVYFVANHFKSQRETEASEALSALRAAAVFSERGSAPPAKAYLQIAEKYSGTIAADQSALLAAGAAFAEGQYEEARAQFTKHLQSHDRSASAPAAAYGIAASLESLKKTDEALTAYQGVVARYSGTGVGAQARLAVGRLLEAKHQPEEAYQLYQEMLRPGNATIWSQEANQRREELVRKFPQLAATNAPAAVMTNAPATTVTKP